jgi:hypothetical protein
VTLSKNRSDGHKYRKRPVVSRICTYRDVASLEVGSRVWSSTWVVVLFQIRLEWRGTSAVLGLVTKSCARVEVQVVVISSHLVLAPLHAPENKSNTAKKKCTSDTANDTTNDLLVGIAQAVTVSTISVLRGWRISVCHFAGKWDGIGAGGGDFLQAAIAECAGECGCEGLERRGHDIASPYDGR